MLQYSSSISVNITYHVAHVGAWDCSVFLTVEWDSFPDVAVQDMLWVSAKHLEAILILTDA